MRKLLTVSLAAGLVMALACGTAVAQPTFSVDFQGPTVSAAIPDSFTGTPIGAADILSGPIGGPPIGFPGLGPLPPPGLVVHGGPPIAPPPGVRTLGLIPGQGPTAEVDALSYGRDEGNYIFFSVDEFAHGDPNVPARPPNVLTEGFVGSMEASADVFREIGGLLLGWGMMGQLPPGPLPPSPPAGNFAVLDGDGLMPTGLPGLGLIEPNPSTLALIPDLGDNLDALDIDTTPNDLGGPIYFSLDSPWPDPLEVPPANSSSAIANGFVGGDVIVNPGPGAANMLYAPAAMLGLDMLGGPDSDDLDALMLIDDGDMQYNPAVDILLFSVRRGSVTTWAISGGAVVDSIYGVPIEEGDILVAPGTLGMVPPGGAPGILVPGEWLGLSTFRAGGPLPFGPFSDDLDALDVSVPEPSSLVLLVFAAAVLLVWRRRRPTA